MRFILLLAAIGALFIAAAFNTTAIFDAGIAIYQNAEVRRVYAAGMALAGIAILVVALVVFSRRAYRRLDRDFPNSLNDRSE
jgi:membrane protein implicated in regulation of membrane protease activity